jgi:hypothetical protein
MPPKSRNVQLAAARKNKELQNKKDLFEIDENELSDNSEEDGIWDDNNLNKITPSVFLSLSPLGDFP